EDLDRQVIGHERAVRRVAQYRASKLAPFGQFAQQFAARYMNITRKLAENRALRSLTAAGHAEEEDRAIFARLNIRHGFRSLRGGEYKLVFKSGPHHEQWECRLTIPSADHESVPNSSSQRTTRLSSTARRTKSPTWVAILASARVIGAIGDP